MEKTNFKLKVTTVLQFQAGQTVEALVHDGKVFIEYPMPEGILGAGVSKSEIPVSKASKVDEVVAEAREAKKLEDAAVKVSGGKGNSKTYTEDELMKEDVKSLLSIIEENGWEVPEEGKNTNKKLRLIILENQAEVKETKPTKVKDAPEEDVELSDEEAKALLVSSFESFDDGEMTKKKLLSVISDCGFEDAEDIVKDFEDNPDLSVEEFVSSLFESEDEEEEDDEEEEEVEEKGKKESSRKPAPKKEEEEVSFADLEEGDRVSVFYEAEDDWFDGEVASINRKGEVKINFDDNTTDTFEKDSDFPVKKI